MQGRGDRRKDGVAGSMGRGCRWDPLSEAGKPRTQFLGTLASRLCRAFLVITQPRETVPTSQVRGQGPAERDLGDGAGRTA